MILYAIPVSSYSAKVRMQLELKNIDYEMLPPPGGYSSPEYMEIISLGTLPGLKDGDFCISESDVITSYLEEKYPQPSLMPGDAQDHARQRYMARYHDLWLEPHLRKTFAQLDPATRDEKLSNDLLDKFQERIDLMEKLIEPAAFMCGDQISIADLAFPATFTLAELILPVFARELGFGPRMQAWRETIYDNPVVKAITDESRQATLDWMSSGGG
jgi:glutathione S-transferase